MTVSDLIEELSKLPPDLPVFVDVYDRDMFETRTGFVTVKHMPPEPGTIEYIAIHTVI